MMLRKSYISSNNIDIWKNAQLRVRKFATTCWRLGFYAMSEMALKPGTELVIESDVYSMIAMNDSNVSWLRVNITQMRQIV